MYEATYDNNENYEIFSQIINDLNLSGEEVLNILTDWHGISLMSRDFLQNYIDCEM